MMVRKKFKKRKNRFLTDKTLRDEELLTKRKLKVISDLQELRRAGFSFTRRPFDQSSSSKEIIKRIIKREISRHPKSPFIKKLSFKKVQNPNGGGKVYILVIKK